MQEKKYQKIIEHNRPVKNILYQKTKEIQENKRNENKRQEQEIT